MLAVPANLILPFVLVSHPSICIYDVKSWGLNQTSCLENVRGKKTANRRKKFCRTLATSGLQLNEANQLKLDVE